jgi:hypothetical protein
MAFLTITGFGDVEVYTSNATQEESEEGGEDTRSFSGKLRTAIGWTKRRWSFETGWLSTANEAALRAVTANGAHVVCSGDALGGSVTCRIKIRNAPYEPDGLTFRRILALTLIEV